MKICVAQTRPLKGDIQGNIERHKLFVDLAVAGGAETVIFPELSITGYESQLAKELATTQDDPRFDTFQQLADRHQLTIGIGVPIKNPAGINIGLVLFQPHAPRQTYFKKYIHSDEEGFFISGENALSVIRSKPNIGLAICYELSVPAHSEQAYKSGAEIYIASVAKTADGVERAFQSLPDIARKYAMTVLMSNCIGPCDTFESAGGTAIWNNRGERLGQLDDASEGLLILDTETEEILARAIEK